MLILCCLALAVILAEAAPRRYYEDRPVRSAKYRRAEYEPWEDRRDADSWEDRRPSYDYDDDRYADMDDDYSYRRPVRRYRMKSSRYTAERPSYRSRRYNGRRLARQESGPEVAPVEPVSTNNGDNQGGNGFKFPEFPSASFGGGFGAAVSISQ